MKDKSINQLLDIVRADDTYLHAGDEILRRVEELEKELLKYTKAFSTLWNCYKELDKERISLSIQVSQAEEQAERLKCLLEERK